MKQPAFCFHFQVLAVATLAGLVWLMPQTTSQSKTLPTNDHGMVAFAQSNRRTDSRRSGPVKRPIRRTALINALRINGLSTAELVREIERRGVDFSLTPDVEEELLAAGATPEILLAVGANYRGTVSADATNNETDAPTPNPPSEPSTSSRLSGTPIRHPPPKPPEPDYDDVFEQGLAAVRADDFDLAIRHFTTAASLQPTNPRAFSMLGMTYLYWRPDLAAAESNMRRAMALGGNAIFRVRHDHDGFFSTFCVGSLFISANDITFRADDGEHTFAATRDIIREVKLNSFVGSEYGAFHIKVRSEQNKVKNFNFAPGSNQRYEAELAVRLYDAGQEMNRLYRD